MSLTYFVGDIPLTYFVGDIHGCYAEYLVLEAHIHRQAHELGRRSFIVSVGDLIDRGPDSAKVVTHFLRGEQAGTHHAILGNHELMLLQVLQHFAPENFGEDGQRVCAWPLGLPTLKDLYLQGGDWVGDDDFQAFAQRTCQLWLNQGGRETLISLEQDPLRPATWRLPLHWLHYVVNLPLFWQDDTVVITHALIDRQSLWVLRQAESKRQPLTQTHREAYLGAQEQALWNRRLLTTRVDDQRIHISGHTPVKSMRYHRDAHAMQIDTGCVYGRELTAYCPALKARLSVPAQQKYTLS